MTSYKNKGIDFATGKIVEGKEPPEITATSIHMGIYKYRKDINSIIHTHAMYTSILGTLKVREKKTEITQTTVC